MDKLHLGPTRAPCPQCAKAAELHVVSLAGPRFMWTDGWVERRDGSPVPPGWVECPHCRAITPYGLWQRSARHGTWEDAAPKTREPSAEALRTHLEELLRTSPASDHAQEMRIQLLWIANAKRRGATNAPALNEDERREALRLLRPPDGPGFEGGIRRLEVLRELGEFAQARALIMDVRRQLDRQESLIADGNTRPQLWDPTRPIEWPPLEEDEDWD